MRDEPSLSDGANPQLKPGRILLTRSRWDAYFLPPILALALIGVLVFWFSSNTAVFPALVTLVAMWLLLRWTWPRAGLVDLSLTATPGMIPLLKRLSICLLLAIGGIAFLGYFLPLPENGQPFSWRITIVWAAFMIGWMAVLLIGVSRIERRLKTFAASDDRWLE